MPPVRPKDKLFVVTRSEDFGGLMMSAIYTREIDETSEVVVEFSGEFDIGELDSRSLSAPGRCLRRTSAPDKRE